MFDDIAPRYDLVNRMLSARIDVGWRKKAIAALAPLKPQKVLDVATGTADVALMTWDMLRPLHITGIDISDGMLSVGRDKIAKRGLAEQITLLQGDSEKIKFADASFDAVTVAFGVRNFEHLQAGMAEMYRVLKPGGRLVVLEFSRPAAPVVKQAYQFYMNVVTPGIGGLFSKNRDAYSYLNQSVQAFPEREQFIDVLKNAGFVNTYYKPLTLGICCMYCGDKV